MMDSRFLKISVAVVEWFCSITFGAILVMVFLQILFRDILKVSAPWTEEGARYLLVLMVYLGAVVALYRRTHVTLELANRFGPRMSAALDVFSDLVVAVCSIVYLIGSIIMIRMNWSIPSITISFAPLGLLYVISAFGAGIVAIIALLQVVFRIIGK